MKYSNFRGVKLVEVMRIEVNEGTGEKKDPIYREVYYVTKEGVLIGKESPHPLREFAGGSEIRVV